jgi:hypothetical protein
MTSRIPPVKNRCGTAARFAMPSNLNGVKADVVRSIVDNLKEKV